jgi:hypothetical protein
VNLDDLPHDTRPLELRDFVRAALFLRALAREPLDDDELRACFRVLDQIPHRERS